MAGRGTTRARRRAPDPVTRYAEAVVEGRIVVGRFARLACERHLRDLETGRQRALRWSLDRAQHAIDFFRFLRHSKGEWAGRVVVLEPWQQFRVGSVFGWQRLDEKSGLWVRRFRTAYNEVARKNGKTTEAAGVGLYMLDADGEPGAEVYAAATKRDQARIVWDEAARMVRKSRALTKWIRVLPGKGNMHVEETASKFEPLGADVDSLDGLNLHCGLIDELHAHRTRDMWDVLETATGSRRQPLLWVITTAGFNQTGICFELRTYGVEVLEGRVQDDRFFAYIATLDEHDDWQDEAVWIKANPNLGVSVKIDDLRSLAQKAKVAPGALNAFLTKRLNIWTQQAERVIPLDLWDENGTDVISEEALAGRRCFGGLDLSSVSDITAWILVFPRDDDPETIDVLCRFWCPEARLKDDHNRYREQYRVWARQGHLKVTPGDAVDYAFIKAQVLQDVARFKFVDMNVDRLFQGHQLCVELGDELGAEKVIGMGQGFTSMAVPTAEFLRRLAVRKVRHGGNPVLRWMAGNMAVKRDPAGNVKPDKAQSQGKIDGIVGLIMALDRCMRHVKPKKIVYRKGQMFL